LSRNAAQLYSVVFPAALTFLQRALARAASLALAAALILRLGIRPGDVFAPLIFAHLALAAAAILARPAALILRRFFAGAPFVV